MTQIRDDFIGMIDSSWRFTSEQSTIVDCKHTFYSNGLYIRAEWNLIACMRLVVGSTSISHVAYTAPHARWDQIKHYHRPWPTDTLISVPWIFHSSQASICMCDEFLVFAENLSFELFTDTLADKVCDLASANALAKQRVLWKRLTVVIHQSCGENTYTTVRVYAYIYVYVRIYIYNHTYIYVRIQPQTRDAYSIAATRAHDMLQPETYANIICRVNVA